MKSITVFLLSITFLSACSSQSNPLDCNKPQAQKFIIQALSNDLIENVINVKKLKMTNITMHRWNEREFSECSAIIEVETENGENFTTGAFDFEIRYTSSLPDSKEVDMFFGLRELSQEIVTKHRSLGASTRRNLEGSIQKHMQQACEADPNLCS